MNKPKVEGINVSRPKTMENFAPTDIVVTYVKKFQSGESTGWEMMWKAAFRTEEDLRKTCFWFGGHGRVESPTIKSPTILRAVARSSGLGAAAAFCIVSHIAVWPV